MKTKVLIIMVSLGLPAVLQAQDKKDSVQESPDEQIVVNREYDDNGNLIRYDSTYTYEWHGDTMMVFPNGSGQYFSPDMFAGPGELFSHFFSDSTNQFSPFGDDWENSFSKGYENFFNQFNQQLFSQFPDEWGQHRDSISSYFPTDSTFSKSFSPHGFMFPDMSEMFDFFGPFPPQNLQHFDNENQQKEWEEIMNNYRKQIEEFNRKWDSQSKKEGPVQKMNLKQL